MATNSDGDQSDLQQVLQQTSDGVILKVYVQPKARKEQIVGLHGDRLKVAVTEPPDKGKANEAVIQLIASTLRVAASNVELLRGQTSRQKDVLIQGVTCAAIVAIVSKQV